MRDAVFLSIVVAFFALCVAYVRGCERLIGSASDETGPVEEETLR